MSTSEIPVIFRQNQPLCKIGKRDFQSEIIYDNLIKDSNLVPAQNYIVYYTDATILPSAISFYKNGKPAPLPHESGSIKHMHDFGRSEQITRIYIIDDPIIIDYGLNLAILDNLLKVKPQMINALTQDKQSTYSQLLKKYFQTFLLHLLMYLEMNSADAMNYINSLQ